MAMTYLDWGRPTGHATTPMKQRKCGSGSLHYYPLEIVTEINPLCITFAGIAINRVCGSDVKWKVKGIRIIVISTHILNYERELFYFNLTRLLHLK